jgi:hypothetical protein
MATLNSAFGVETSVLSLLNIDMWRKLRVGSVMASSHGMELVLITGSILITTQESSAATVFHTRHTFHLRKHRRRGDDGGHALSIYCER